ncbi:hypothetical protein PHAVU_006G059236, partial [Phaseolus vulgaris]
VCIGASTVSISNVSPHKSTSFKDNGGFAYEFSTLTTQPISPNIFGYNHAPTPSTVPATHVSAISPNTIIFEHVPSGWVQMPNYLKHSTPPVSKSHHKHYERRTENEHRLFLIGLQKCSSGDWKSISKCYIPSKTSTQIASHAKKYRHHQNGLKKNKKRKSIHDVTLDNINMGVVPSFINKEQRLCLTPNFSIQPQKI